MKINDKLIKKKEYSIKKNFDFKSIYLLKK